MDFIKTILEELTASGLACNIKHIAGSTALLTASNRIENGYQQQSLSIIAVPISALSAKEAELQSKEMEALLKYGPAVIIPEDRWRHSRQIMKTRILAHLGIFRSIYARDCEVRKINRSEADNFLQENHSYGGAKCKYCYGIFLKRIRPKDYQNLLTVNKGQELGKNSFKHLEKGELIAAAEFSNARRWNKGGKDISSYEWIRYASLPELRISGGMGKILKQFIRDIAPDDIMSYADLEWSDGEAYRRLGFIQDGTKSPVTFAINTQLWTRTPVLHNQNEPDTETRSGNSSLIHYFQNLGSIKYRLKLTEYSD